MEYIIRNKTTMLFRIGPSSNRFEPTFDVESLQSFTRLAREALATTDANGSKPTKRPNWCTRERRHERAGCDGAGRQAGPTTTRPVPAGVKCTHEWR